MDTMVDWGAITDGIAQAFDDGYKQGKADAMKWIPVEERFPSENGKFLVVKQIAVKPPTSIIDVCYFARDLYEIDKYDFVDKRGCSDFYTYDSEYGYYVSKYITPWMPLPELPIEGEA